MQIEPPSLNIPFEREEHWGLWLVIGCAAVTGIAALFNPSFAIAFAASSIVGLPVVVTTVFPSSITTRLATSSRLARVALFIPLFGYIALAKKVLVPFVIAVIEHFLF